MSEIEVGEYIRTDNGYIGKYLTYEDNDEDITAGLIEYENKWINPCIEVNIVKHSFNLIDLIEVRRLCEWRRSCNNLWI